MELNQKFSCVLRLCVCVCMHMSMYMYRHLYTHTYIYVCFSILSSNDILHGHMIKKKKESGNADVDAFRSHDPSTLEGDLGLPIPAQL